MANCRRLQPRLISRARSSEYRELAFFGGRRINLQTVFAEVCNSVKRNFQKTETLRKHVGTFATRLRSRRNRLGLTQEDLALKTGFSTSSITAWERGVNPPTSSKLSKLAEVLGVDMSWLLVGAEELHNTTREEPRAFRSRFERLMDRCATLTDIEFARTEPALLSVIDAVVASRPVMDQNANIHQDQPDQTIVSKAQSNAVKAQRLARLLPSQPEKAEQPIEGRPNLVSTSDRAGNQRPGFPHQDPKPPS